MKQCPRCAEAIQDEAVVCRFCGFDYAAPARAAARSSNRQLAIIVITGLVVIGAIVLGNYRLVSGAPGLFVKRQHFGFDEPFAALSDCTSGPWIVASAQHGPLCADLQAAGILESDAARAERFRREVQVETDRIMRQATKEAERLQEQVRRELNR